MSRALFEATRSFNWQPQEHYGPGETEDYSEWNAQDFAAAESFLVLSKRMIRWSKPTAEWTAETRVKGDPDWFADTPEGLFVIGQNVWLGFPDPPEFTIVQLDPQTRTSLHLGHFDHWPSAWIRDA